MTEMTPQGRAVRHVVSWSARLLVLAFALAVVGAIAVVVVIPRLTHSQAMTVLSGSMTPGIPVGSIVVVRPVDPDQLRVGDVATYQAEPRKPVYVTHRVADISHVGGRTTFTFKGDANRGPDVDPVVPGQIRGQLWFHVPFLGTIRDDLKTGAGMTIALTLLLGGYAVSQLSSGMRDKRNEKIEEARHVAA
jgi:signal peptidase I